MTWKKGCSITLKVLALTAITTVIWILATALLPSPEVVRQAMATNQSSTAFLWMLFVNLVSAGILAFVAIRGAWHGVRLTGALFLVVFGMQSFMIQLETLFFGGAFNSLSSLDVILLSLNSLVKTALIVPAAVWIFGRAKRPRATNEGAPLDGNFIRRDLLWRVPFLGIAYTALYFFFGYFVAWQSVAVREFYATTTITRQYAVLIPFQVLRGMLWVACGAPLFAMFARRREAVIASVLSYSLLPSLQLLLPNPLMPQAVRLAHMVEISSSMALFGLLAGTVMTSKRFGRFRAIH